MSTQSEPVGHMRPEAQTQIGRYRLSAARLLGAIISLFVIMPFVERWRFGHFVESAAFTIVLLAAVTAVGRHRKTLLVAMTLAVPALVGRWLSHVWSDPLVLELGLAAAILFVVYIIWSLLRAVMAAPVVDSEVLCTTISTFLLLAAAWSFSYLLIANWDRNAFDISEPATGTQKLTNFTALYFSVQVLTTITFGDILPVSNIARMMAIVEAAAGVFYMAILVARLVGLYMGQADSHRESEKSSKSPVGSGR